MQHSCRNKTASSTLRHKYRRCKQMHPLPKITGSVVLAVESALDFIASVMVIACYSWGLLDCFVALFVFSSLTSWHKQS